MTKKFHELHIDSLDVAAYVTKTCAQKNLFINLTKLQKLMYCVYGAFLVAFEARICDEHPKAWQYGPVFPKVYNLTKKHQFDLIDALLRKNEIVEMQLNNEQINLISEVVDFFGQYNAKQLVDWSHHPNGAWSQSTVGGTILYNEIPDDDIYSYFKTIMQGN